MSQYRAVRLQGLCYGSIWKEHTATTVFNDRTKSLDFCVLVGNMLLSFESFHAFRRGDSPLSDVRIVGASSWNPRPVSSSFYSSHSNLAGQCQQHAQQQQQSRSRSQSPIRISTNSNSAAATTTAPANLSTASSSFSSRPSSLAASLSSTAASVFFGDSTSNLAFRIITSTGTHIDCTALSTEDRDTWLAAIQVGLHISVMGYMEPLTVLAQHYNININSALLSYAQQQSIESQLYESNYFIPPTPRVTESPLDYSILHPTLQSIVTLPSQTTRLPSLVLSLSDSSNLSTTSPDVYHKTNVHQHNVCTSCGRIPPEHITTNYHHIYGYPLIQYGLENIVSTMCYPCLISQGVLRHVMTMLDIYAMDSIDRSAFIRARKLVLEQIKDYHHQSHKDETSIQRLLTLFQTPAFVTYRRQSPRLDQSCHWLEQRVQMLYSEHSDTGSSSSSSLASVEDLHGYVSEYLDALNQQESSNVDYEFFGSMKKEALKVAGDMGTAIKLLYEYAIPTSSTLSESSYSFSTRSSSHGSVLDSLSNSNSVSTETFSSILDFFLDLCRDGDLASVAFYWPQICQIHLQMLPPLDITSLARVELMEDFLITVSTKFSIHLALELAFTCVADLEESLGPNRDSASASCRRRKYALLRFVCELESYVFDFDGGWGGGSVSLRGLFTPSEHQGALIRSNMGMLQMHRQLYRENFVTGSTRLEKFQHEREILERSATTCKGIHDLEKENEQYIHAKRKMNLARKAEYYHAQIMFTRRLGDIAEKLRFIEVQNRLTTLQSEIELINASGRLGGDPTNKITDVDDSLMNVVRIPPTECHVFRSKARTPILLLMELERERFIFDSSIDQDMPSSTIASTPHVAIEITKVSQNEGMSTELDSKITSTSVDNKDLDTSGLLANKNDYSPVHYTSRKSFDMNNTYIDEGLSLTPRRSVLARAVSNEPFISESVEHVVQKLMELNYAIHDLSTDDDEVEVFHDATTDIPSISLEDSYINMQVAEADTTEASIYCSIENPLSSDTHYGNEEEENAKGISMDDDDAIYNHIRSLRSDNKQNIALSHATSKMKRTGVNEIISTAFKKYGEGRRQVLRAIFMKAVKSPNFITRRVAPIAQRAAQAIDSHLAVKMLLNGQSQQQDTQEQDIIMEQGQIKLSYEKSKEYALRLALEASMKLEEEEHSLSSCTTTDSDECMESLRLLLIRDRVARGLLTLEGAAQALSVSQKGFFHDVVSDRPIGRDSDNNNAYSYETIDAGALDSRLAGCGAIGPAIAKAIELWKYGTINDMELLDLVRKDTVFSRMSFPGKENESRLLEDSVFWEKFAFGEMWVQKKARIRSSSPFGMTQGWELCGVIVKSNDDVRQESFVMQMIELCKEIFDQAGLELWIHPYRILATSKTTGIIEMVRNAMSIDSLKKRPGCSHGGLLGHFQRMAQIAADPDEALLLSKVNFVRSLAAYSLITYLFNIKDRHNGNLLIDSAGHIIHIDFGFVFGLAPGGNFSLEQSVPFKLTDEMIEVMDGIGSKLFLDFTMLFCCGFVALQLHADTFLTLIEITCSGSTFKCFEGRDHKEILQSIRSRFCLHLNKESTIFFAMDLIHQATISFGTAQYDFFQYISNGIAT